jgi:hypothetical protein
MPMAQNAKATRLQQPSGKSMRQALPVIGIVLFCLFLGAGISVLLGQDGNWDIRNYHLYIGWAALHGRLGIDLAAASIQS